MDEKTKGRVPPAGRFETFGSCVVPSLVLLLLAAAAPVRGLEEVPTGEGDRDVIPVEEVRAGQRGYGLSVFSGTVPERFEVEVLGVLRNTSPQVSYILARLSGHGLELTGVVSGMSGSPVFLDGRLAGAVAFAWPFAEEPVAGITPIAEMRGLARPLLDDAALPVRLGSPGSDVGIETLVARKFGADFLDQELQRLGRRLAGAGELSAGGLQWVASGFADSARVLLSQAVGTVAPSGRYSPEGGIGPVAGGSVAAVLVDGDLQVAATGTVTEVRDGEILAFGHPFLGVGSIRVPMVMAEVVMVVASQQVSFKIANIGPVVGAFVEDRLPGVRGELGLEAPMIPLTLRVRGARQAEYRMRLARVPALIPSLLASSTLSGLEAGSHAEGIQGLDLRARFELAGYGSLEMNDSFLGSAASQEAASLLLVTASFLEQNVYAKTRVENIEVDLVPFREPHGVVLAGARAETPQVRPGQRLRLHLDLRAYRGKTLRRTITIDVPPDLPPGRHVLVVADGRQADDARLSYEQIQVTRLEQKLALLRSLHSRRQLVVFAVLSDHGLAVEGSLLPRLPASVRGVLRQSSSQVLELGSRVVPIHVEEMGLPVLGMEKLEIEVLAQR